MRQIPTLLRRELTSCFSTPLIPLCILTFLVLGAGLAFYLGHFFERNQADLKTFFAFHPWLYVVLMPVLTMGLWAEEYRSGSIELLLTLPISVSEAVVAKFLSVWVIVGVSLVLTFPMVLTVNYLGAPDNGAILVGYVASWLLAGACLAIGCCTSAMTHNKLQAYVFAVLLCFLFMTCGFPQLLNAIEGAAPQGVIDKIASLSALSRFERLDRGVLDARDLLYFLSLIAAWLAGAVVAIHLKRNA